MTGPLHYPTVRIPMYILTRVTSNGNLVYCDYKTRAETMEILDAASIKPSMQGDDFETQVYIVENGDRLILKTIYLQNSIFNNREE